MVIPKINSAHGSDTRNIINRAIDSINVQGNSIQDLVAKGQLTPAQYLELIQSVNGLISKGNVTLNDLSEEVLSKLNEMNPEFNLLSVPRNKSVSPVKTDFIKTGKNMFDKSKAIKGKVVNYGDGTLNNNSEYYTVEFIDVIPGSTITVSHVYYRAFYDVNKTFITGNAASAPATFTVPSNAYYMSISVANVRLDVFQVELGSNSTDYEPYKLEIPSLELESDIGNNNDVRESKYLEFNTNTRTTEAVRENGRVSKIHEKSGNTIIKTTELIYSQNGIITQINEIANGKKVATAINRIDGQVATLNKGVQNV